MNWILASLVMFFSSVGLYLFVRKSSLLKIPTLINNLAMFSIPAISFFFIGVTRNTNLSLSMQELVIILIAGLVFSYAGNRFSLMAIEIAPNAGYSLILSKSYVVFTTVVAVLFLNAVLSLENALAILMIIAFSALIMLSGKVKKKAASSLWIPYSFVSFFCWGMLSITSKYLFNHGMDLYTWLIYIHGIVTILTLLEMRSKKVKLKLVADNYKLFLGIGVSSLLFNLFMFGAIEAAPNVGYVNAVNASSISMVTIASAVFFKDELTIKKMVGILGVTSGLILLLT